MLINLTFNRRAMRACLPYVAAVWLISCVEQQPEAADLCGGGPNCVDAGAEPADMATPPTIRVDVDAGSTETPSTDEVEPREICPGLCVPDDPLACAAGGQIERSEVQARNREIRIESAGLSDAGELQSSGGAELEAGAPPPVTLFDASLGDDDLSPEDPAVGDAGVAVGSGDDDAVGGGPGEHAGEGESQSNGADGGVTTESEAEPSGPDAGADAAAPLDVVEVIVDGGGDARGEPTALSCQLSVMDDEFGAACAPAGAGEAGDACSSARDCAPGLGCVGKVGAGQCLPYCCAGSDACGDGSFCTLRPLRAPSLANDSTFVVPVCARAEQCDLMQPYPCPPGEQCSCPTGQACTPVGTGGANACVEPGSGVEGEACPCGPGHFCSARQTCLKICQFGTDSCGQGMCQAVGGFPEGFGLCGGAFESMEDPAP